MGMDTLVQRGKKQTWISSDLKTERTIVAIEGKKRRLDVPLADSYHAKYLGPKGATVVKVEQAGQIAQVGVEDLRLVAPPQTGTLNGKHFNGLPMSGVIDGWMRNLRIFDSTEAVGIGRTARASPRGARRRYSERSYRGSGQARRCFRQWNADSRRSV